MSHYCVQYSPAAYEDLRAVYRYIALELQAEETAQASDNADSSCCPHTGQISPQTSNGRLGAVDVNGGS